MSALLALALLVLVAAGLVLVGAVAVAARELWEVDVVLTAQRLALSIGLLALVLLLITHTARALELEVSSARCDRNLSAPLVVEPGEAVELYGEGAAPVVVDRPVVYCIHHSTGRPI